MVYEPSTGELEKLNVDLKEEYINELSSVYDLYSVDHQN